MRCYPHFQFSMPIKPRSVCHHLSSSNPDWSGNWLAVGSGLLTMQPLCLPYSSKNLLVVVTLLCWIKVFFLWPTCGPLTIKISWEVHQFNSICPVLHFQERHRDKSRISQRYHDISPSLWIMQGLVVGKTPISHSSTQIFFWPEVKRFFLQPSKAAINFFSIIASPSLLEKANQPINATLWW